MTDNSKGRKKALIISVLAFLFIGGGVFLFFIIQGANDLTGADKNRFSYGGGARGAASSFFKFLGFDSVEAVGKKEPRSRQVAYEGAEAAEAALNGSAAPASASSSSGRDDDQLQSWGGLKHGGSVSPTSVPRMAGGGLSGAASAGAGGTQSSAGASRFGEGSDSGAVRVSGKSLASAATPSAAKGTLGSLQKARAMLSDGLRSGSAMTARAKWDSSFGVGGAKDGKELAYSRGGLVSLDKIKSGEIDNLKTTADHKSLAVPEVPGFKQDAKADVQLDADSAKKKDEAESSLKKSLASSLTGAAGDALTKGISGSDDTTTQNSGSCDMTASQQSGTCGTVQQFACDSDTKGSWEKAGTGPNGEIIYNVTYQGSGPGITDALKGQVVNYTDTGIIMVDPKTGNVVSSSWPPTGITESKK